MGRGRGGLPRCQYPGVATFPRYTPASPYLIQMTREQEPDLLKGQAEAIKAELSRVEVRICDLEANKKE
ncbi:rRNA methyltransferase [Chloroflexota bacterium]